MGKIVAGNNYLLTARENEERVTFLSGILTLLCLCMCLPTILFSCDMFVTCSHCVWSTLFTCRENKRNHSHTHICLQFLLAFLLFSYCATDLYVATFYARVIFLLTFFEFFLAETVKTEPLIVQMKNKYQTRLV